MVVIWNTERVTKAGEVSVLAKAHTDVDIVRMRLAAFDDTRFAYHLAIIVILFKLYNTNQFTAILMMHIILAYVIKCLTCQFLKRINPELVKIS